MGQRSGFRTIGVVLISAFLLTACSTQKTSQPTPSPASSGQSTQQPSPPPATTQRLSVVTGGTSGVYYVYGGGLAKLLSKNIPGVEATAEVTAASVENLNLLNQKSADIAFTLADTAYDAVSGRGKFQSKLPLQAVALLYGNITHVVAMADSPINSIKDLKGKKVSVGAANSGTEVIALRLLKAAGLDPDKDITKERLSVGESAAAMKDKKIDAFFWSGGLPTAGVLELASTPNVKIKLISHDELVPALVKEHGSLYVAQNLPANTYPNTPAAKVSAVPNLLVVRQDMDEALVYNIVKTMFEQRAELEAVHPAAKELDLKMAATGAPMDFHPGAIKYYKEKGVWTGK